MVLDAMKEVCLMINACQTGNEQRVLQHHVKITELVEKAWETKKNLMKEVAEVGEMLVSRNDFINLSAQVNTIADYCNAVSYRLTEMFKRRWKIRRDILKEVESLADASLNCLIRLRELILSLSYGVSQVMDAAMSVEAAEKTVDNIYRKVDLRIISSKMKIPQILILREVAEFLEGIADISENVADIARILSITT
jgi:uncharacterized protein Yka (UPF0111/DUF47 family)